MGATGVANQGGNVWRVCASVGVRAACGGAAPAHAASATPDSRRAGQTPVDLFSSASHLWSFVSCVAT